ncbi:hypothetical protein [Streptomyces sp. NPDC003832]
MPTSASDSRHAPSTPAARRRRASTHTTSRATGTVARVTNTTPLNVSRQPCHCPDTHLGADISSGRRRT